MSGHANRPARMSAALDEQLADELGVSPDEAKAALNDYLDDLQARVDAGETVTIPGLGTVVKDEGELCFMPSEALQEAVNYRNTHLSPMTVSEASAPDEEIVSEPPPPVDDEPVADEDEPADEAVPDLTEDWAEELDDESTLEPEGTTPPVEESASPPPAAADENGPTTAQIAGLIASVVLLFAVLGYVLTTQGLIPGFGPDPQTASTPPAAPDTAVTAAAPDTASATTGNEASEATSPSSPSQSIDRATGGWTIVVASRTRPGEAKALLNTYRQRFRGEGLPTDILTGETNGQLRYRIAVGQYDTREAAMTARRQLAGRIPDDAWPLEIQPNS